MKYAYCIASCPVVCIGFEALLGGSTVGVRFAVVPSNSFLGVVIIVGFEKNRW